MRKLRKQISETVTPDDVNLDSFRLHDTLDPEIWHDGEIDIRVRRALLMIARDFISSLAFDIDPVDVIVTGSAANYNWDRENSDIDLHILVDFSLMPADKELLNSLFKSIKTIWNEKHGDLHVAGYPVELYVQDVDEPHAATGMYSLLKDEWITKPSKSRIENDYLDERTVKDSVAEYCNDIDALEDELDNAATVSELAGIYNDATDLFGRIRDERATSMKSDKPEISEGNLIFKSLRRNGYLEKLIRLRNDCYNRMRSID